MPVKLSKRAFEEAVGNPLEHFAHQWHYAATELVRSGLYEDQGARVARGVTPNVHGQHSWVVLGGDCYDPQARVIDPTLWSYWSKVTNIWVGRASDRPHQPHGAGNIWHWGKPCSGGGQPILLEVPVDKEAEAFLELLGPLDRAGWQALLSSAPVGGWPAAAIVKAAYWTPQLRALIPIDRVGMLTDINPGGLYLPGDELVEPGG